MKELVGAKNLRILSLVDSDVTDESIAYIKDCKKLEILAIGKTAVTQSGSQALCAENVNLTIYQEDVGMTMKEIIERIR